MCLQIQVPEGSAAKQSAEDQATEPSAAAASGAMAGSGAVPAPSGAPHLTVTGVGFSLRLARHSKPCAYDACPMMQTMFRQPIRHTYVGRYLNMLRAKEISGCFQHVLQIFSVQDWSLP